MNIPSIFGCFSGEGGVSGLGVQGSNVFCQGRVDLLTLQMRQIGAANPLAGLAALGLPALNTSNTGGLNPAGKTNFYNLG